MASAAAANSHWTPGCAIGFYLFLILCPTGSCVTKKRGYP